MRTTPNASVEYHRDLYRDLDADTAAVARAARAESTCSECGSDFGMQSGWTREVLLHIQRGGLLHLLLEQLFLEGTTSFFRYQDDDHELYLTCYQCNPGDVVPDDFTSLTPEQVVAWLARECQCPDCVRERNDGE